MAVTTAFAARDCDFETFANEGYLRLSVDRANYKEEKTYKSGGNQYTRAFATPQLLLKAYIREIQVKIADDRTHLYDIIQLVARASIDPGLQTQTPNSRY